MSRAEFPPGARIRAFGGHTQHGHLMSRQVRELQYINANVPHSPTYRHAFGDGVQMWGLSDGSLLLVKPGHRLWNLFDLQDGET